MKRKIAVILAADIAGYSRLIAEDEEDTLRRFEGYRTVFTEFVDRGGGRIFNTAGDAILAEFQSAVEAVRCAVDVQESLRARNLAYPPSRHMFFRIGITIGDVVEREGGDLLGDGVNIAARLESVAPPGGICVSRSVHEAVASKMTLRFADAGPQALKNIPERVHAYTLAPEDHTPHAVAVTGDQQARQAPAQSRTPNPSLRFTALLFAAAIALAGAYAYRYLPSNEPEIAAIPAPKPAEPPAQATRPAVETEIAPKPETAPQPEPTPQVTEPAPTLEVIPEPEKTPEPAKTPEPDKTPERATAPETLTEPDTQSAALSPDPDIVRKAPNPLASRYVLTRQWTDCHESDTADVAAGACKALLDSSGLSDADQAVIRYKYGRALRDQGQPDAAIENYDKSVALKPTADAYNHRGVAYFDKGDFTKAIADYTEALRISPSLAEAFNNRAWTRYTAGDLTAALDDANRAIKLDGSKAYSWDTRGHINEARGANAAAISDYRKALSLDAQSESSSEGLKRLGVSN